MALIALILLQLAPPDSLLAVMDGDLEETSQLELPPRLRGAGWTTLLTKNGRDDYDNPWGWQMRLWYQARALSGTITLDRDAGEPARIDQTSGYLVWTPGRLRITTGTFRVSAGSGSIQGQARLGNVAKTGARLLRTPRIRGYAGTAAYSQSRGIAVQSVSGRLGAWISQTRLDGRVDSEGVQLTRSSTRRTTGEIDRRRAIPARAGGLLFDSRGTTVRVGVLLAVEQISGIERRAAEVFGQVELPGFRAEASASRCSCGPEPSDALQLRLRAGGQRGKPTAVVALSGATISPRGRVSPAFAGMHLRLPLERLLVRMGAYQSSGQPSFHLAVAREPVRLTVDHRMESKDTITAVGLGGLTTWASVPKTRIRLSGGLPHGQVVLSAARLANAWSILVSVATTVRLRGFHVSAGLADFSTEAQAPTMTLYESVPRHAFPLVTGFPGPAADGI